MLHRKGKGEKIIAILSKNSGRSRVVFVKLKRGLALLIGIVQLSLVFLTSDVKPHRLLPR
jgi:hypothetical protein